MINTAAFACPSVAGSKEGKAMNIVDLHCDTISRIYQERKEGKEAGLRSNAFHLDLEKMKSSGYLLQNFAIFVDFQETEDPIGDCRGQMALFREEMEKNKDIIAPVAAYQDMARNRREGKLSALMALEEGELCQGSLERLRDYYALGVRMVTFTWNYPNSLGWPASPASYHGMQGARGRCCGEGDLAYPSGNCSGRGQGLTSLGIEFLEEMECLGIIPDVSHLSDAGIRDVCRLAKKPFCASHSNARALCPHPRNLPDGLIRSIAVQGGVIGVNYYGAFLDASHSSRNPCSGDVSKIAAHIRHISNVGGISCIGLGSDFDGFHGKLGMQGCSGLGLLEQALRKNGFRGSEIDKVFYQNVLGFYQELL